MDNILLSHEIALDILFIYVYISFIYIQISLNVTYISFIY